MAAHEAVQATLAWLRALDPPAVIGAFGGDGQPAPVPPGLGLPSSPPVEIQRGDEVLTGIDAVAPEDRAAVIRAYERARQRGLGRADVHTVQGHPAQVHFLDLRDDHGVVLVASVLATAFTPPAPPVPDLHGEEPPRVAWMCLDRDANVVDMDDAAVALLGWSRDERIGKLALPFLHPDDREAAVDNWLAVLGAPGERRRYRVRHRCRDGSWLWLQVTNLNRLDDPAHGDVLSEMVDISEEMAAHDALRERERLLRELTDALPIGIVQFDAGRRVVHENEQLAAIVGAPGLEGLLGVAVDEDRPALEAALAERMDEPPGIGVVFVDLDRFKPVNDAFGHAAGDELLMAVGERLRRAVRDVDLVGRLGGDEFLVVCPGVGSIEVVASIALRVAAALDAPLAVRGEAGSTVSPHASVGVAWAEAGTDPQALVARADAAMYESKRQSRSDPNTPTKLTISPG